jgi:hypothetical protein
VLAGVLLVAVLVATAGRSGRRERGSH